MSDEIRREVRLALLENNINEMRAAHAQNVKDGRAVHEQMEKRFDEAQQRNNEKLEWMTRYLLGTATAVVLNLLMTLGAFGLALYERLH